MMKKTAIIFDHDGTLVDSIDCVAFCTNKVLENAGFKSESVEKIKHGMAYPTAERFVDRETKRKLEYSIRGLEAAK